MIEYDPHRWRDFFRPREHMFATIGKRSSWLLVWAAAVATAHFYYPTFDIPSDAHALIGPALSLLLVFRTNASYDRFWEGRKLWGTMVNTSRGLARACRVHLSADGVKRMTDLLVQFPVASMKELRGAPSGAVRLTLEMTQALREQKLDAVVFVQLDTMVQTLLDCLGGCERIHKTPLPFAYVMHLRRALVLYCVSLPFALVHRFGWATPAVVFSLAIILFGIEEIGVEIEDPFGEDDNDLPLEKICATIERDVRLLGSPWRPDATEESA